MTMLEKVARAIYQEFENRPLYAQTQMNGVIAEECARAAIEAMRAPTPEMIEAGCEDANCCWSGMIDAALTPAPEARKG